MEGFFKTLTSAFLLWLFLFIAVRIFVFFPHKNHQQPIPWNTTFLEMKHKSARFDGCEYKGEVTVVGISASFYNLLLIETMEVRDACGETMLVVGDFATPMPGDIMLLTADFVQVMNNSAVDNCCILVYKADN